MVEGLLERRRPGAEEQQGEVEDRVYDTEKPEQATEAEIEDEKRWREYAKEKEITVQSLKWAVPVKRKTEEVISAAASARALRDVFCRG